MLNRIIPAQAADQDDLVSRLINLCQNPAAQENAMVAFNFNNSRMLFKVTHNQKNEPVIAFVFDRGFDLPANIKDQLSKKLSEKNSSLTLVNAGRDAFRSLSQVTLGFNVQPFNEETALTTLSKFDPDNITKKPSLTSVGLFHKSSTSSAEVPAEDTQKSSYKPGGSNR